MAEYSSMFAVSGLAAILFFGGWNGAIPITSLLPEGPVWNYLGNFLGMLNFIGKCTVGVLFMMWVRWTLPRLRIDQVMTMCLKYCVPIAAVMFLGATLWTYVFPGGVLGWSQPYGDYRRAVPAGSAPPAAAAPAQASVDKTATVDTKPAGAAATDLVAAKGE